MLKKSSSLVREATGEPLKTFDNLDPPAQKEQEDNAEVMAEVSPEDTKQVDSSHSSSRHVAQRYRPTTVSRMLHTSHSVLRDRPTSRHAMTTSALERRKPPPSTASREKAKVKTLSQSLLGPITVEPRRSSYQFVVPSKLSSMDWENELARSIINVFSNKARKDMQAHVADDFVPREFPSFTSDVVGAECRQGDDERDFQRVSISRQSRLDSEFFPETSPDSDRDHSHRTSLEAKKASLPGRGSSGTFRLKMIWFKGEGKPQMSWDGVVDCDELSSLEERGKFMRYVEKVEAALLDASSDIERDTRLWSKLVVACNCFATMLVEKRQFPQAMEMLQHATKTLERREGDVGEDKECLASLVNDTYALYYTRRMKPAAAYQYLIAAINAAKRGKEHVNLARYRLHQSYIQCNQHRYAESLASLRKVLGMVESGDLDISETSDQNEVLLLTAVAYHNIAIQQLLLGHISDACVSSQNARRLARLCLSVSSHYLPVLESTHKHALGELASVLKNGHREEQARLFERLIEELFE